MERGEGRGVQFGEGRLGAAGRRGGVLVEELEDRVRAPQDESGPPEDAEVHDVPCAARARPTTLAERGRGREGGGRLPYFAARAR